jgi:hypothetical protein
MRKYDISPYMGRPFNCSILNFLIYEENFLFFFISVEFIMHVPDVCRLLNTKYKVPFVGKKQNSKRFPEGLKVSED